MITTEDLKDQILTILFEGYLASSSTSLFDVSDIILFHGKSPFDVGQYLVKNGWIKFHNYVPNGFHASISMSGIAEIRQDWIDEYFNKVIGTLGINGNDWMDIMEILDLEPKDYQIAFDLAKEFQARGYIKAEFRPNQVFAQLTLEGKDFYEENAAKFIL